MSANQLQRKLVRLLVAAILLGGGASFNGTPASALKSELDKASSAKLSKGQYPVGYAVTSTEYDYKREKAPYKIAVWYPCPKRNGRGHNYEIGPSAIASSVSVDAPVAKGHFPILFYSHGATGSGTSSFFICELLARNGYIVIAPDYLDTVNAARIDEKVPFNGFMRMKTNRYIYWLREYGLNKASREGRSQFAYRPEQLKQTIDLVLQWNEDDKNKFHDRIDIARIGLFGHSFGAWTSVLTAGADSKFYDQRVKAVVSLSGPVNHFVYKVETDNDLKQVKIPILFEYGEKETAQGRADDKTVVYDFAGPPKMLLSIKEADHLSFSGGIKGEHKRASEYIDDDPVRKTISETTLDFFDAVLKNDKDKLKSLKSRTDGISASFAEF